MKVITSGMPRIKLVTRKIKAVIIKTVFVFLKVPRQRNDSTEKTINSPERIALTGMVLTGLWNGSVF